MPISSLHYGSAYVSVARAGHRRELGRSGEIRKRFKCTDTVTGSNFGSGSCPRFELFLESRVDACGGVLRCAAS
jgi:hypothetical protein